MVSPATVKKIEKQRAERVRKATERTGFREGRFHIVRTDTDGNKTMEDYVVEVEFYPKEKWFCRRIRMVEVNRPDCRYEYRLDKKREPLTKDLWALMETLRL